MSAQRLTERRLAALSRGSHPSDDEMRILVRLAALGRLVENAPELVVLSQGVGGSIDGPWHNTWAVDTGFAEDPSLGALLGHRVKVIRWEQVLEPPADGKGSSAPQAPRLVPGVRPPRHWPHGCAS